jgi:NAD(P)-dependent dehydrogenase (short-subunit alcohol dehydrogenase family)
MPQTWFVTGATRGLGVEFAKAALAAGHNVVATGRDRAQVAKNLGEHSSLLILQHDVVDGVQSKAAVTAAVDRFGTIDVLVNNAGYGHLGFFEETSDEDAAVQFDTNVFGLFKMTRAVLPIMRAAKRGLIINLSSLAGIRGNEYASLYCASKFAVEGFSEALSREVWHFGIHVMLVEPGPFRTDFLTPQSLRFGQTVIGDYDTRRPKVRGSYEQRNGQQPGDPVKLAQAVVELAKREKPPLRFVAGSFAYNTAQAKLDDVRAEYESLRELALGCDY